MSVAKGADYPIERTKKSGIPFSLTYTVENGKTAGTSLKIIKPTSNDYVLYIDRIFVDLDTNGATFEIEIDSPYLNFYDAPASDSGATLAGLINDPAKVISGTTTKGNIYLDGQMAAYFNKKGSNPAVAATGKNGAWEVKVGANTTVVGSGKMILTFSGVQVKKKKGTTDTSKGQV